MIIEKLHYQRESIDCILEYEAYLLPKCDLRPTSYALHIQYRVIYEEYFHVCNGRQSLPDAMYLLP